MSGACYLSGPDIYPSGTGTCSFAFGYTDSNGSAVSSNSISATVVDPGSGSYFDHTFTAFTVSGGGFDAGAANAITFPQPADTVLSSTPPTLSATASSGAAVTYGSNSAAVCTVSGSTLTLVSVGTCSITASQAAVGNYVAATSVTQTFQVLAAPPTVTAISPSNGTTLGGTSVTLTGTNFTGATGVRFGATAASFTVNSATSITATSPAGSSGTVDITVTTSGGTSATSAADLFTYQLTPTVAAISPTSGPASGGTSVTLTGANFSGATVVKFGATATALYTINSATEIRVTSPAGSGTVDITVTTPNGTSPTSAADQFSYVGAPTVTGLSPTSGPTGGGTSVILTGTNLSGATAVKFGSTAASFTVNSATQITATSPAGSGTVDVTVVNPGGTSATSAADQFSYLGTTSITVQSSANPSANGQSVTFTATVAASGTPTGTVTFKDGAATIGTATLTAGSAEVTTTSLSQGAHTITASYGGDASFAASTSPALVQTVGIPADSVKLRSLQVAATKLVAQQSGQAISGALSRAVSDALGGGGQVLTLGGTGLHVNLSGAASGEPSAWTGWADLTGSGLQNSAKGQALSGDQVNGLMGVSYRLNPDAIVGVLGGYEAFRYTSDALSGRLSGQGWSAGPYVGWKVAERLNFDFSAVYSDIGYDAEAGSAKGRFTGARWLVSSSLNGAYEVGSLVLQPSLSLYGLKEYEDAYIDTLGTDQADRTFMTGRMSAGSRIALPALSLPEMTIAPYVGLYGDYYFTDDDAASSEATTASLLRGWSARTGGGFNLSFADNASLALGAELGGIGSETKVWTYQVRGRVQF